MPRYKHRARTVAFAGLVSIAALAVSAGTAAASRACPPGNTNPIYCTQKAPNAFTQPATHVTATTATLNGAVNGLGSNARYYFEYGKTTRYGHKTPTQLLTPISGCAPGVTNPQYCVCPPGTANPQYCTIPHASNVSADVSRLASDTRYHFRVVAYNANGTAFGQDRNFKTHNVVPISSVQAPGRVRHSTRRHTNHFTVIVHLRTQATVTISLLFKGNVVDKFREGRRTGEVSQRIAAPRTTGKYEIEVVATANGVTQTVSQPIRVF